MAARSRAIVVLASAGITAPPASIDVTDDNTAFAAVRVTIDYPFPVTIAGFIPGLDNATIPLRSTTTMRREY